MARKKAFPLRLEPEVYLALRRWADSEFRSVNGQIEYVLRNALIRRGMLKDDSIAPKEDVDSKGRRKDE